MNNLECFACIFFCVCVWVFLTEAFNKHMLSRVFLSQNGSLEKKRSKDQLVGRLGLSEDTEHYLSLSVNFGFWRHSLAFFTTLKTCWEEKTLQEVKG